jgi:hypothetical protein
MMAGEMAKIEPATSLPQAVAFLTREREAIVDAASVALGRSHARHYDLTGTEDVRVRFEALFDRLLDAVTRRDLGVVLAYARHLAEERFSAGYDLSEVQTAFNAFEEAIWSRAFARLDATQLAESLGLVSTVLGAAKDALAREYVSLATHAHSPSLDLRALFDGAGGSLP